MFCGKHAKATHKRIWTEIHNVPEKVTKIQKVWRGYMLRNWIRECGPGCLKRSLCHNDEELITLEEKNRQYPLDYFSFEEDGKVLWFDVRTMIQILETNLEPQNPYTRTPLSLETRRRLREICYKRKILGFPIHYPNQKTISRFEYLDRIWLLVSQVLEENGFSSIHPQLLSSMSIHQHILLLSLFLKDLKVLACEHVKTGSRRHKYVVWTRRVLNNLYDSDNPDIDVVKLFFTIFRDTKNPFHYCFIFASSLYKM
jgi:hypothetical protein